MKATALAFGAISIVNAIARGNGAALGVSLTTEAEVELYPRSKDITVEIENEASENPRLAQVVVRRITSVLGLGITGAHIRTKSTIPIGRGLKSSSAAANAIGLATMRAAGGLLSDEEIVMEGSKSALEAQVSITGALDDAGASYFGGIVITNNLEGKILTRSSVDPSLQVLIYVPETKKYTWDTPRDRMASINLLCDESFNLAREGEYWKAMIINGLAYSAALDISPKPAIDALAAGALAAGLSGKGPSIAAISVAEKADQIRELWSSYPGTVISTLPNNTKAHCLT
tara:strand:- start:3901 stop:4764 length:864 start_codon:yes stop_codon:yes gene_type:complete